MPDRIIRASILTSSSIDRLSADAERTCWRLLTIADDWGRMEADVRVLLSRAFPLKIGDVSRTQMETWLTEIEEAGIVVRYLVDGKPYAAFLNWSKHNKLRNKHSKYPGPGGSYVDPDNNPATCPQLLAVASKREQASEKPNPQTVVDNCPQMSPNPESESESESESNAEYPIDNQDLIGDGGEKAGLPPDESPSPVDARPNEARSEAATGAGGVSPSAYGPEDLPPADSVNASEVIKRNRRPGETDAQVRKRLIDERKRQEAGGMGSVGTVALGVTGGR